MPTIQKSTDFKERGNIERKKKTFKKRGNIERRTAKIKPEQEKLQKMPKVNRFGLKFCLSIVCDSRENMSEFSDKNETT